MNSLQQELNNINQQLEHLNARKAQLEPIISEYTDVIKRVKNLTENMIALNIEPTNLRFDLEDILEGNAAGDWVREADIFVNETDSTPEPTSEPQPGQDFVKDWIDATTEAHSEQPEDYDVFYPANDWEKVAPHAYYHSELRSVKLIVPWVNIETLGEVDEICNEICHQAELANSYEIEEWGDNWAIYLSVEEGYSPDDVDSMIAAFFPEPELTPEPTPQPVRLMAFVPFIPGLPPELTQEPTPEPDPEECPKCEGEGVIELPIEEDQTCPTCGGTGEKPEPQPELVQINMQIYRRQNTLLIGFTSKRLMNAWEKWFIKSTPHVKTSNLSDRLQGFNYCLTLTWDTDRNAKNWEYLAKLNYSLKPTEQNRTLEQVANSEEE